MSSTSYFNSFLDVSAIPGFFGKKNRSKWAIVGTYNPIPFRLLALLMYIFSSYILIYIDSSTKG